MKPDPVKSDKLEHPGFAHGFFTRAGGVSDGIYAGLNVGLGSGDEQVNILENRDRVAREIGTHSGHLLTAYQVHSPDALHVSAPWKNDERPKVDALVTTTPGIAIGVLTADCGPVIFQDQENRVVGAAHAGWKGATGGVLDNTIAAMEKLGAKRENIKAVLGPTISGENYEVGPEFVERLCALNSMNATYLKPSARKDHAMFDLPFYIVDRLNNLGVTASWTGHCTYADEETFFSYRRTTHKAEPDYGRQISAIMIQPEKG